MTRRKRRQRTTPYWQTIAAIIVMYAAIIVSGIALYHLKVTPYFQEHTETTNSGENKTWDCLYYHTESICCEQKHWLTSFNTQTNATTRYTTCFKLESTRQTYQKFVDI